VGFEIGCAQSGMEILTASLSYTFLSVTTALASRLNIWEACVSDFQTFAYQTNMEEGWGCLTIRRRSSQHGGKSFGVERASVKAAHSFFTLASKRRANHGKSVIIGPESINSLAHVGR